ncbi:hypothetical protein LTR10_013441 [Elasticomyces elasticus]|uniref:Myb-like DNA-binding domain-containing protein n=1 Tax=Exophiala sideris TaxID=1016849 RepID=A0ABR0J4F5_9EURO|nr:hypothetical protein LTR10_013441 [Elasticomyces elasticus]KAK5027329.1 hypothetical protein LTS07_006931 [Exophiala sideris]KAK5034969.1 hypothetical protein LTR13_006151 [Exophiala sideris]KAK5056297.1 hypothetical protein LTR69_007838 [Exophiala sideris]KAK5181214.1 hypothetical protein LTR44_006545 [Eurotiomycetes sp. CCFEE 6388]
MPPKATKPAGGDGPDPKFAFVWSVLRHAGELNVDWNGVAEDNGIGYARNASSKFKDIVKKQGFKFEGNKICLLDETPPAATAKPTAVRKRKATTKKEEDDGEVESKTAAKKTKKSAPKSAAKVKEEDEEAEDDEEEVKEEEEA